MPFTSLVLSRQPAAVNRQYRAVDVFGRRRAEEHARPGYIATDNTAALRADPARSRQILERIPAGRWGRPEDIAGACVFLCSPAAEYINGAILPVDGGWLAR